MQLHVFFAVFFFVGVNCVEEQQHVEREEGHGKHVEREPTDEERRIKVGLDERSKELLLKEKNEEFVAKKGIDYFLKNPNTLFERECFAKFKPGESIDFVIDVAPSPVMDKVDTLVAESPVGLYLQGKHRSVTKSYFDAISYFIEAVTIDMKPELTHSIIYDNGRKYFIHGREIKKESIHEGSDFKDMVRNLKTLWPVATKSVPDDYLRSILKNNLGRLTKLALWNRDNGLPTVLSGSKRSKAVYTVVITDGASGAKIHDLSNDIERTTVIDIGNQRFVKNMNWDDMNKLASVFALPAPQAIWSLAGTIRMMSCRLCCH